jgi:L-ascorbate metabolism protein UlaG (beta-lactamase superfamily)
LIDPFLTGNPSAAAKADEVPADLILISHGHGDHVGDAVSIAKRTGAVVATNYEISEWLQQPPRSLSEAKVHGPQHGGGFVFDKAVRVKLTLAFHGSMLPDGSYGGNPCGFIVTFPDGTRIYDAADTGLFGDMALIGEEGLDLAIVPIGDYYTMGPDDALRAVKLLRPRYVLPIHYNTFPAIVQDAGAWAARVKSETSAQPVRRFTVDEYHQMIQIGVLGEDDDVELLEGWIVPKMARTPTHDGVVSMVMMDALTPRLARGWFCRGQSAITTADSEPEPDVAVVRGAPRDYLAHHPGPADMALVIEVADSSLSRDRSHKAWIYATAAVPVYWIINLVDDQVEVYSDPTGPVAAAGYRSHQDYRAGDSVPFTVDGRELGPIPVRELLP